MSRAPLEPIAPLLMIEVNPFWQIKLYPVNCRPRAVGHVDGKPSPPADNSGAMP